MKPKIWAYLMHLGTNLWYDKDAEIKQYISKENGPVYRDFLRTDEGTFDRMIEFLPSQGINTLVIDLGEGIRYDSHPELAIKGTWSKEKLREKLERMRAVGLEPIPKINFSACHDAWLQQYERMLSTDIYRGVAKDLIDEVSELFGQPRLFHLGMDEENAFLQREYGYAAVRGETLWWKDFLFFCDCVEKNGARPWIWSDYCWAYPEIFARRMPKEVLQSNWYYGTDFYPNEKGELTREVQTYLDLEKLGYDQVPTCSTWGQTGNSNGTVIFGKEHISPEHLTGFMTAPWQFTVPGLEYSLKADAAVLAEARRQAYGE